jgi:hypothetical protein
MNESDALAHRAGEQLNRPPLPLSAETEVVAFFRDELLSNVHGHIVVPRIAPSLGDDTVTFPPAPAVLAGDAGVLMGSVCLPPHGAVFESFLDEALPAGGDLNAVNEALAGIQKKKLKRGAVGT